MQDYADLFSTAIADVGLKVLAYTMPDHSFGYMIDSLTSRQCNERTQEALSRLAEIADSLDQTVFVLVDNYQFGDADFSAPTDGRSEDDKRLYDWLTSLGYHSIGNTEMGYSEMICISQLEINPDEN